MKLLFVHSGEKVKEDKEGNLYVDGAYSKQVFQRYLNLADELTVVFRKDKFIYEKEYAKNNFEPFDIKNIKFIEYKDRNSSIKNFFNIKLIMENKKIIKKQVMKNDKIIVRLPSPAGYEAAKYAKKMDKEYLAEVVGCIWDALSNYGIKGKIMAINYFLKMKKAVKNAKYAIYVTKKFLQKRYPNRNININCSDVVIKNLNEEDLINRKEKILHTNLKEFSLGTVAAIDVKYKGQKYVLKAISKLKKEGYNIKYYIIGSGDKTYLQNLAVKLKIENNIEFTGPVIHEEVFKKLNEIDLYIQPSLLEGLCRAIIEAMSKACPVIVSNVGGNTELIKDKKFIFKRKNVRHLVKIIKNISKEQMIEQAENNFDNAKEYLQENLEEKRKDILEKFVN